MTKRAAKTKKVGLEMKVALYDNLSRLAQENGQTKSFILEKAVEHYIRFIAPTQRTVRPEIMAHARRSVQRNRKLLQRLAE
jgi:predicted transcriptional regulator